MALTEAQSTKQATILLPLSKSRLKDWSSKVKAVKDLPVSLIGLYDDNPFLEISIPENGAGNAEQLWQRQRHQGALVEKVVYQGRGPMWLTWFPLPLKMLSSRTPLTNLLHEQRCR